MTTTRFIDMIDAYKHEHGVTDAEVSRRIGLSRAAFSYWRSKGLRDLPAREHLYAVAAVIGRPYRQVLDAALHDIGYLGGPEPVVTRSYHEVLADTIAALTEAARLTNNYMRQTADGTWEPDPTQEPPRIDWAAFVTEALAGAAANVGSITEILAGRPGSWEAAMIEQALVATVGNDPAELLRRRTDPVRIVLHAENVLTELDTPDHLHSRGGVYDDQYHAAETELQRRENAVRPTFTYSWPGHELSDSMREYYTDLGVTIIEGPPPPRQLSTVEEIEAFMAAEQANPTPLTPAEQAEDDALDAIDNLRERLAAQQRAELADYADALRAAIIDSLTGLNLPVPVNVEILPDYDPDHQATVPIHGGPIAPLSPIDDAIADAIMLVPTPDTLPGTPLQRLDPTDGQQ